MMFLIPAKICCEQHECKETSDVLLDTSMEPNSIPDGWQIFSDRGRDPYCYCPHHTQELMDKIMRRT